MGNKRGRAKRNKKPNNWTWLKEIRQDKRNIDDESELQRTSENQDLSQDAEHLSNIQSDNDENDDYEHVANKRRKTCSSETRPEVDPVLYNEDDDRNEGDLRIAEVCENYFECLSVEDDENDNDNKTQSVNDPLTPDDYHNDEENHNDEEDHNVEEDYNDEDHNQSDDENHLEDVNDDYSENIDLASNDGAREEEEEVIEDKPRGTRLMDVIDIFNEVKRVGRHSRHCDFNDMILESETRMGLKSILKFRCENCGVLRNVRTCLKKPNKMNYNDKAVLGITAIGSGYYHLAEFFSYLSVPVMGNTLYDKIQREQQEAWDNLARESALEALHEEIEIARRTGSVDLKGNALISVICDGGWGKRSYGKAFNSLSGCAVLIGEKTKKVVYYGTRNKYCHICAIAKSKNVEPREHTCKINYIGPSSGMEADIIVEGFRSSEQYGARYFKFIADGDSSTYKAIRDNRIYRNPDLFVEKFECVNHLCRNFRTKFSFLSSITKFNCDLRRQQIKPSKAQDICKGVKVAAKHWRESNLDMTEKVNNLEEDVMNAPNHYFGVHDKCKSYFCKKVTEQGARDNLKLMQEDGLYYEVLNLCQSYFAFNAKSLIMNYTNNPAEEFNNIVAKFLGGKRINYSLAGSYSARVAAAVVQYNSKGHAGSEFLKFKFEDLENSRIEQLENKRKRKLVKNEIARQGKPRERRVAQGDTSNVAYFHGDGSEDIDMTPAQIERAKEVHFEKLKCNQRNWRTVEKSTTGGRISERWQEIRQDLIPSSFFSKIIKAKNRTSYTNHLEELMYKRSEFGNSAEVKHQRLTERFALQVFEKLFDGRLKRSGIFIDKDLCYLCASPIRLYGNHHILNIKCPLKQYNKKFDAVIDKIPFWKKEGDFMNINKNSDWYIELQADIHITRRKYGYMMVWLGEFDGEPQYRVVEVPRDDNFFEKEIKPKLDYFYNEVMLKELVDPRKGRKGRNMKLRVYNAATQSFV